MHTRGPHYFLQGCHNQSQGDFSHLGGNSQQLHRLYQRAAERSSFHRRFLNLKSSYAYYGASFENLGQRAAPPFQMHLQELQS